MTDYHKKIASQYDYSGYTLHFKPLHQFAGLVKVCCLLLSVAFSTFFFKGLVTSFAGEYDIYFGAFISIIIAVTLHISTNKLIVYHEAQKRPFMNIDVNAIEPFILILFLASSIGGIMADFKGSPELSAHFIGSAPVDTHSDNITSTYSSQISAVDSTINAIETDAFYWCKLHRERHKCDNPKNKRYVDKSDRSDLLALEKIEKLQNQKAGIQATMNTLLTDASSRLNNDIDKHNNKLDMSRNRMQFASITVTAIYLLLSIWGHKYGRETVKELKASVKDGTHQERAKNATETKVKKKKRKQKRNQYEKQAKELNQNPDDVQRLVDAKFAELLSENNDLLDEYLATRENEKAVKKQ